MLFCLVRPVYVGCIVATLALCPSGSFSLTANDDVRASQQNVSSEVSVNLQEVWNSVDYDRLLALARDPSQPPLIRLESCRNLCYHADASAESLIQLHHDIDKKWIQKKLAQQIADRFPEYRFKVLESELDTLKRRSDEKRRLAIAEELLLAHDVQTATLGLAVIAENADDLAKHSRTIVAHPGAQQLLENVASGESLGKDERQAVEALQAWVKDASEAAAGSLRDKWSRNLFVNRFGAAASSILQKEFPLVR